MKDLKDFIYEGFFDRFKKLDAKKFVTDLTNAFVTAYKILHGDESDSAKIIERMKDPKEGIVKWDGGRGFISIGGLSYSDFLKELGFKSTVVLRQENGKVIVADVSAWQDFVQNAYKNAKAKQAEKLKASAQKSAAAAEWSSFCARHLEDPNTDDDGYAAMKKEVGKGNTMYKITAKYQHETRYFWFGTEKAAKDAKPLMIANGCKEIDDKPKAVKVE